MLQNSKLLIDPVRRDQVVKEMSMDALTETGIPGARATAQQIAERRMRALADLLEEAIPSGTPRPAGSRQRR